MVVTVVDRRENVARDTAIRDINALRGEQTLDTKVGASTLAAMGGIVRRILVEDI